MTNCSHPLSDLVVTNPEINQEKGEHLDEVVTLPVKCVNCGEELEKELVVVEDDKF